MTEKTQHTEPAEVLRNWLRVNREARNITMRILARRMKVSPSWVAKTESGERRLEVLEFINLCMAMGIDPCKGLKLVIASHPDYPYMVHQSMLAAERQPEYGTKTRRGKK